MEGGRGGVVRSGPWWGGGCPGVSVQVCTCARVQVCRCANRDILLKHRIACACGEQFLLSSCTWRSVFGPSPGFSNETSAWSREDGQGGASVESRVEKDLDGTASSVRAVAFVSETQTVSRSKREAASKGTSYICSEATQSQPEAQVEAAKVKVAKLQNALAAMGSSEGPEVQATRRIEACPSFSRRRPDPRVGSLHREGTETECEAP